MGYTPPVDCLKKRPCPFPQLTCEELQDEWAKELKIGYAFAHEGDFYRAITAFKRARILTPCKRVQEIDYAIILSYYLAEKYEEVLTCFQGASFSKDFPAYQDLLIILYDTERKCGKNASQLLPYIEKKKELEIASEIADGHFCDAVKHPRAPPFLLPIYRSYLYSLKSPKTAGMLNTLLPGAGYWYVEQKNTAITALLINALFVATTYQLFHRGYTAAGIFVGSLEMGWYLGGIYGATRAAVQYNEYQYETYGRKALDEGALYPTLMLRFTF